MSQLLNLFQGTLFSNNSSFYSCPSSSLMFLQHKPCLYNGKYAPFRRYRRNHFSLQARCWEMLDHAETFALPYKEKACDDAELDAFPDVQTLRNFPKEELLGKIVLVRFDSRILLREELDQQSPSVSSALCTIKYLYDAGAKVILVSNWSVKNNTKLLAAESVAEFLSAVLQLKVAPAKLVSGSMQSKMEDKEKTDILLLENLSEFREELANCSKFAELLSTGIDIFANDAFSQSHRIHASTVAITRFCYACVAGFHFEEGLCQVKKAIKTNKKQFIAIIGGGKLLEKAAALHCLAARCDGLVFVGMMAFQIMHAQGLPVPKKLVERGAIKEALNLTQFAKFKSMPILFPKDFWCINDHLPKRIELFPAHNILDGWVPVDIGPKSLDEISSLLSECKKILWIGPVKFGLSSQDTSGASKLATMLDKLNQRNCDITVVGNMACEALTSVSTSFSSHNMVDNASVLWDILKGRKLPGLMALDRAYPFVIDWNATYTDPAHPLVVDIGSGNGLFLFRMARRRKDLNFLGLEINEKLVSRCLAYVHQSGMKNGYFIAANATSTFRSIVSSYPGKLVLVSIQCPNPDFNKPEHRWSMLQRLLIEAIADLLASDGKVFLQSDIEAVAVRMKEQFVQYGKGKLAVMQDHGDADIGQGGWLKENPFGVWSDWEQHVIDRGALMYRLLLYKSTSNE
ncbi:uncharacterized protein LOC114257383 [Camellia sinensis]|uniref:uncharacterized protein LOC114257383 n=1 Tax=Camellia sinensis TaxID=4442 RepID=UPI0010358290|nr:uncharacterized protein LOC114257383 [Camellia sinensis]